MKPTEKTSNRHERVTEESPRPTRSRPPIAKPTPPPPRPDAKITTPSGPRPQPGPSAPTTPTATAPVVSQTAPPGGSPDPGAFVTWMPRVGIALSVTAFVFGVFIIANSFVGGSSTDDTAPNIEEVLSEQSEAIDGASAVSYTHLTLPTKRIV